ncbi:MAG: hypothetical protein QOJ60_1604 [Actinomycetota bacterium]|nr:hypothetical protein [Actinomycetota bacterium]
MIGLPCTDPYAVLGVSSDATQAEIAHAYRQLVRRHHPDLRDDGVPSADGAGAALERVLRAYALLRDPQRRAEYDRLHEPAATTTEASRRERPHIRSVPHHEQPPLRVGPVVWHPGPT